MENNWEKINQHLGALCDRMKVDGGWLYRSGNAETIAMCFVPDVDLTRYQAHLRDAYKKGYEDGQQDAARGVTAAEI